MAAQTTKKKKSTKKKSAAAKASSLRAIPLAEIVAVCAGTAGVILSLALLSYYPPVPASMSELPPAPRNWIGSVGAELGGSLVGWLGIPALMVPVALLLLAVHLFQHHAFQPRWTRILAGGALTGFTCILLSIYPETVLRGGVPLRAGGGLGDTIAGMMIASLNTPGTVIVVLACLVVALQMTLAVEIGPAVLRAVGVMTGAARLTGSAVALGAGAAASGASSLSQRMKDALDARREELERRRQELDEEEEEEEALDDEPAEEESSPRKKDRTRASLLTRKPVPVDDEPEEDESDPQQSLPLVARHQNAFSPDIEPLDEEEGGEAATGPMSGGAASMDDDEEGPPIPAPVARGRKGKDPAGPKIIKSRFMEDAPAQFSGENPFQEEQGDYELPPMKFLKTPPPTPEGVLSEEELLASARLLEEKLRDYGVEGRVVEIHPGPVITMYEYAPAPGVKVAKITNLSNDLALALRASAVRIVAPLPGKAAVGIEVPNKSRQTVYLREILDHEEFRHDGLKLPIAIGKDISGKPYVGDMARMPHLLVAGSTGTGKSVGMNAMLLSIFYSRRPDEVRLILVDPKMIEFSVYHDIPHLLMPVVTEPGKAASALNWAVEEMERRYRLLTIEGARNIANYNGIMAERAKTWDPATAPEGQIIPRQLPYIVIVIDELADLMMVAGKEVQDSIVRLAQKARAAGLHLIVATQRPSVDVITGLIKANFPARIAFKVASKTDSRTILDANGAEYLLGNGDMLHVPPGTAGLMRLHGAFTSDEEARLVADHLRAQGQPRYEESLLASTSGEAKDQEEEDEEDYDEHYEPAKAIVLETGQASISTIQRRLKIGYNRSARLVERMAKEGLVGPPIPGGKPREVFMAKLQASLKRVA